MPSDAPGFQRLQRQLTDWLREPETMPAPDVERRRLDIYRELLFNNVRGFVETAYPVLKRLLPVSEWDDLVAGFFARHRATSPYFRDISLAFRQWVEHDRQAWLATRPWAAELLHYEWMELAADCAETGPDPDCRHDGDLLAGIPCLRRAVWPLAYRWPVHRLGVDGIPAGGPPPAPTCLLFYRDQEDCLQQLEVSPLAARLVERLQAEPPCTGRALLLLLADETGQQEPATRAAFLVAGAALLEDLRTRGVIAGTRLPG